jgi:hypothetical protein
MLRKLVGWWKHRRATARAKYLDQRATAGERELDEARDVFSSREGGGG